MVILSHIRSRTSSPDSGAAMALVTDAMSVWMERPRPSQPDREEVGNQRQEWWDHNTAERPSEEGWKEAGLGGSPSGKEDPDVMVLMEEEPG